MCLIRAELMRNAVFTGGLGGGAEMAAIEEGS
jgi:hypothetical protein